MKGSEVFHFHGRKSAVPGPDVGNTLSGRKRSCSESIHSGSINRVHPVCSDVLESSCLVKVLTLLFYFCPLSGKSSAFIFILVNS